MITLGDAQLPARFWEKVEADSSGCWLWTASTDPAGYGYFTWEGKQRKAHRVMMQIITGRWPGGRHVLHSCDVPGCVFPGHLRLGSHRDNMRDRASKGRGPRQAATHCPSGHPITTTNTLWGSPTQGRKCRVCNRDRMRRARSCQ